MRQTKVTEATCVDCGKTIYIKHPNQVRCKECQEVHIKETHRLRYIKKKDEERKKKLNLEYMVCDKILTCEYGGFAGSYRICDYLSKTGELRGCPVLGCTKYKEKVKE